MDDSIGIVLGTNLGSHLGNGRGMDLGSHLGTGGMDFGCLLGIGGLGMDIGSIIIFITQYFFQKFYYFITSTIYLFNYFNIYISQLINHALTSSHCAVTGVF
jgi:hypothetical protein